MVNLISNHILSSGTRVAGAAMTARSLKPVCERALLSKSVAKPGRLGLTYNAQKCSKASFYRGRPRIESYMKTRALSFHRSKVLERNILRVLINLISNMENKARLMLHVEKSYHQW